MTAVVLAMMILAAVPWSAGADTTHTVTFVTGGHIAAVPAQQVAHGGWVLTIAFFTGLIVDIFNNTPGMNALACTIMAAVRRPVFNLFVSRENDMNIPIPSVDSMGVSDYFKYMATLVTGYCTLIFLIQAFSLHNFVLTLARIAGSSVLSVIIIFGLDSLVSTRREKRL